MKTNKEIKPFKMRCESKDEYCTVKRILEECGVNIQCGEETNDILINAYFRPEGLVYTTFEKHFDEPEPELTYSEFMKLYGVEEEVALEFEVDYSVDCGIKASECDKYKPNDTSCHGCIKARYKIKTTND